MHLFQHLYEIRGPGGQPVTHYGLSLAGARLKPALGARGEGLCERQRTKPGVNLGVLRAPFLVAIRVVYYASSLALARSANVQSRSDGIVSTLLLRKRPRHQHTQSRPTADYLEKEVSAPSSPPASLDLFRVAKPSRPSCCRAAFLCLRYSPVKQ